MDASFRLGKDTKYGVRNSFIINLTMGAAGMVSVRCTNVTGENISEIKMPEVKIKFVHYLTIYLA